MSFHYKCCFCIPLKQGALVLGYVLTVLKIVMMYFSGKELTEQGSMMVDLALGGYNVTRSRISIILICFIIIMFFVEMIISIRLIVGLHKMNRVHIEKFFKVYPILFSLYLIAFIIYMIMNAQYYNSTMWLMHLIDLGACLIELYTIHLAYRCAIEMKTQSRESHQNMSAIDPIQPNIC